MTPPLPRVWLKATAATRDADGMLRWPAMRCNCRILGILLPDGSRVRFKQALLHRHPAHPEHELVH